MLRTGFQDPNFVMALRVPPKPGRQSRLGEQPGSTVPPAPARRVNERAARRAQPHVRTGGYAESGPAVRLRDTSGLSDPPVHIFLKVRVSHMSRLCTIKAVWK